MIKIAKGKWIKPSNKRHVKAHKGINMAINDLLDAKKEMQPKEEEVANEEVEEENEEVEVEEDEEA